MPLKSFKKNFLLITLILATVVLLSALEMTQPFFFTGGDSLTGFLPAYTFNWRALIENNTLPLINFHQYLGVTHLGQADMGVLYPPAYLAVGLSKLLFRDIYHSIEIFVYLHYIASVLIIFLLLRKLKNAKVVSFFVALLWITNPYLQITSKAWAPRNIGIVFIPLNFLILEKVIKRPNFANIVALATVKMFFAFGDVQITGILILLESMAMIVHAWRIGEKNFKKGLKAILPYLWLLILFVLLSSIVILPIYQTKLMSATRSGAVSYSEFIRYAISFDNFKDAQLFIFHPKALFEVNSHIYYIGLLVLALPMLLLIRRIRVHANKQHRVAFYGLLAIATYLLSTSLHGYLYNLPVFSWFRGPYRYFPFFVFFLLLTFAGVCSTIIKNKSFWPRLIVSSILVLSLSLNILVIWQNKTKTMDPIRLEAPPKTQGLKFINKEEGRVFTYKAKPKATTYYRYLTYSFATLFDVNHFAGSPPLIPKNSYDLSLKLHHASNYTKKMDQLTLDYISSWSVKYIMTNSSKSTKQYLESFPQIKPIYQDEELSIYKNKGARPYVYEPDRPQMKVPFAFGVNRLDIYPANMKEHKLIVSLAPLPNYVIYADDKKIGKVIPNNEPITINVPADTKHIAVRYIDPLFNIGAGISISTLLSIILYLLISYSRKLRQKNNARKQITSST